MFVSFYLSMQQEETLICHVKKICKYPVANKNGELVGIITQRDLLNYFTAQRKKFVMGALSKDLKKSYPV